MLLMPVFLFILYYHHAQLQCLHELQSLHEQHMAYTSKRAQCALTFFLLAHRLGDDVPLSIVSVQPISPHLRLTAPRPIAPHPLAGAPPPWGPLGEGSCPRVVPPVDVLCQLEGSGACWGLPGAQNNAHVSS